MAEFDDKLNSILSNPDAMAQIMQLAQSLSGGTEMCIRDRPRRDFIRAEAASYMASPPLSYRMALRLSLIHISEGIVKLRKHVPFSR